MSTNEYPDGSRCEMCDGELLFESPNMADWPTKIDGVGYLCPLCLEVVDCILADGCENELSNEEVNTNDNNDDGE